MESYRLIYYGGLCATVKAEVKVMVISDVARVRAIPGLSTYCDRVAQFVAFHSLER